MLKLRSYCIYGGNLYELWVNEEYIISGYRFLIKSLSELHIIVNICRILPPLLYDDGDLRQRGFSNDTLMKMSYIFKNA